MPSTAADARFGAGRLFLTDARLALALLNSARYPTLNRLFGASREQANVVTFFVALVAADATYRTARRVFRAPFGMTGTDVVLGGFALSEAASGVTGPPSRDVPQFGTLVAGAVLASLAAPGLRRAARRAREAEARVRRERITRYRESSARAASSP
jgi:hypothetical protein